MIANTKINLSVVIQNTKHLREVLDMLTSYGIPTENIQTKPEKTEKREAPVTAEKPDAKPEKEIGPMERQYLDATKKEWMRVPSDWTGTREELAEKRLEQMTAPPAPKVKESILDSLPEDDGKPFGWED